MPRTRLTTKQERIYDYIKDHIDHHHYAPTVREIQKALGYKSSSTVHQLIEHIEAKGYIERKGPRAIKLLEK